MAGKVQKLDLSGLQSADFSKGVVAGKRKGQKKRKRNPNNAKKSKEERALQQKAKKYARGKPLPKLKGVKDKKLRTLLKSHEKSYSNAQMEAARSELLLPTREGGIETENPMEKTFKVSQKKLVEEVDVQTQKKIFNLKLDTFGPYSFDFSRNGRHLILGGRKGHLAMMNWSQFKLKSEHYPQEQINDVCFLHDHTMYAVAQQKYCYIYDTNGVELHVLKNQTRVNRMTFLPYHFLLATVGVGGYLKYLDTSIGRKIAEIRTRLGPCDTMAQNPRNAVIHLGHQGGIVSLWTPNLQTPAVKMLCHRGPVRSLAVDNSGLYMVTAGQDGKMKVWDVRTYKELHSYYTTRPADSLSISQKGLLALGCGSHVQIWKQIYSTKQKNPYMTHELPGKAVRNVKFCPYEDVLGISHSAGFSSIVIPGSGEPNFDTFEVNPFENRKQRREKLVRSLLDKVQPEMITLNPDLIGTVDTTAKEVQSQQEKAGKPLDIKNKSRGKSGTAKKMKRKHKNIIDWDTKRRKEDAIKQKLAEQKKKNGGANESSSSKSSSYDVLNRFK